ncbi:MAG TPA: hypothetical protein VFP50_18965 [Anaeromyxobacteraceae bacterium]|nr:hypothetical protein [Anaeromyxobacteraceae bacterium]
MTTLPAALLAVALLAEPTATFQPPASLPAAPEPRDPGQPPAGTGADQALWRRLYDGTSFAALHLARIGQCAFRIRYARYYEGLDERIATAAPADAAAARTVRARLEQRAREADAAQPADGGRIRACRYTLLDLEQRMDLLDDPKVAAAMPKIRAEAAACAARMEKVIEALRPAADRLEAALSDVDHLLGRAPPGLPGAPGAPPDPRPVDGRDEREER